MTEALYYKDPYLRVFDAGVVGIKQEQDATWVALNATAFYPEGGGQPADQGTLETIGGVWRVTDVQIDADGMVWHRLQAPATIDVGAVDPIPEVSVPITEAKSPSFGAKVTGRIDWERRYDHMQQHLGQHILSAAFVAELGAETVSFHLGAEYCTIDLNVEVIELAQALKAEQRANQVVWSAMPVQVHVVDAAQAQAFRLRKAVTRETDIRIVTIGDFDHSGCGGTHPKNTAEVGIVKVTGWEKTRGLVRVEFVCGWRGLQDYRSRWAVSKSVAEALGMHWQDAPGGVASLQNQLKAMENRAGSLAERLAQAQAGELLHQAATYGNTQLVTYVAPPGDGPEAIRALSQQLLSQAPTALVALLTTVGEKPHLLFVRNGKPGDGRPSMVELLRPLLLQFGGKGGGSPVAAQGGIPSEAAVQMVLDAAVAKLQSILAG